MQKIVNKYSNSREELSLSDKWILQDNNYVLTSSSPDAFKRHLGLIKNTVENDPTQLDLNDPIIRDVLNDVDSFKLKEQVEIFSLLNKAGISLQDIPDGALFEKSPQYHSYSLHLAVKSMQGRAIEKSVTDRLLGVFRGITSDFKFLPDEEKQIIINTVFDLNIPATILPEVLLTDPMYVGEYCKKYDFDENILTQVATTNEYSPEIEKQFVKMLGYNSLDEVAAHEIANNVDMQERNDNYYNRDFKNDLPIMLTIKMRALKQMKEQGIENVTYHLNQVPPPGSHYNDDAVYNSKTNSLTVYLNKYPASCGRQNTLKHLLYYSTHEVGHAIQHQNLITMNLEEDPDIELYAMDQMIRFIHSKDSQSPAYYRENMKYYSLEFDAEYKAAIDMFNLQCLGKGLDSSSTLLESLKREVLTRAEKEKELKQLQEEISNNYEQSKMRNLPGYETMELENLFVKYISSKMTNPEMLDEINKYLDGECAILKYKFDFGPYGVRKRSESEYLKLLEEAGIKTKSNPEEKYLEMVNKSR